VRDGKALAPALCATTLDDLPTLASPINAHRGPGGSCPRRYAVAAPRPLGAPRPRPTTSLAAAAMRRLPRRLLRRDTRRDAPRARARARAATARARGAAAMLRCRARRQTTQHRELFMNTIYLFTEEGI
jgi:hypothetical protein